MPPPRTTRPRTDMRERILDVALELFTAQGYDKTSLREISDRLGVTKAALYYHFTRKDDILLELHLRLHQLADDAWTELDGIDDPAVIEQAWPALMDRFVDAVVANRPLFELHQRNQQAFEKFRDDPRHLEAQGDMEQRFRDILGNPALPIEQRVRMACTVGAVMMGLMGSFITRSDDEDDAIAGIVRDVVARISTAPAPD